MSSVLFMSFGCGCQESRALLDVLVHPPMPALQDVASSFNASQPFRASRVSPNGKTAGREHVETLQGDPFGPAALFPE